MREGLDAAYKRLRSACHDLEVLLGIAETNPCGLSAKDLKRLDKAVTVMKTGFKIAKKAKRKKRREPKRPALRLVGRDAA